MTPKPIRLAILIVLACVTAGYVSYMLKTTKQITETSKKAQEIAYISEENLKIAMSANTVSGNYLAGLFAQRHHDWKNGHVFLGKAIDDQTQDLTLLKQAMIVAIGSGHYDQAFQYAQKTLDMQPESPLAKIFLSIQDFKNQDYASSSQRIKSLKRDPISTFFLPLLESWSAAANGDLQTSNLNQNIIHIYHSILIADYLKKYDEVRILLERALQVPNLQTVDFERIADMYVHIGDTDKAKKLYEEILRFDENNSYVRTKITDIENDHSEDKKQTVNSPENGLAQALYDTARLLYQEYSDDSARVFAHLALYLNPDMIQTKLLLGSLTARNEQYESAIKYYLDIPEDTPYFQESRRHAAEIMEEQKRFPEAEQLLETLIDKKQDIDAAIQIGDMYRRAEQYDNAVKKYNRAAQLLGKEIPYEYWHLYYVRGMSYERGGKWDKAEKDLAAALEFKPNEPNVLNYLGYSWADMGINLDQALEMIKKAAELRPSDGYIADSVGWVYYKMGRFDESIQPLEKAVALLPYDPIVNDHLGDAYWQVGRIREARFQWERAKNNAEETDADLIETIQQKLMSGLPLKETQKNEQ